MAISVHKTIIEVDVSQAVQADQRMRAATDARVTAAKDLARQLEAAERAEIRGLKESEDAARRRLGWMREAKLEAKLAIQAAREEQAEAKELARTIATTEKSVKRLRSEWEKMPGPGLLEQTSAAAGQAAERFDAWGQKFKGVLEFGSKLGNIASGVQAMIGMVNQAIDLGDQLAEDSIRAKNVGANLQVSIEGARNAFKGYVSDVELGRIANQAFELGVVETGAELEALAAGVQAKAERLGVDSTQLFENAVTAIGRGSALILDNLGIVLDQAKAEEIYAKSLGVTIDQLSALQKEEAFQKAAMIEIARAGEEAANSVDGLAESWKRGRVEWQNFKDGILGFDDDMAKVREALRQLTEEEIERLRFGEVADDAGAAGKELNSMLAEWGVSLKEVRALADETGLSYQELLDKAQKDLGTKEAERARKEMEATHRELAGMLNTRADEIDQQAKITGIIDTQGDQQRDILVMQEEALLLRLEAAEAIKDQNAQLEITRALEENRARQEVAGSRRRRGGGRVDPNAALDRDLKLTLAKLDAQRSIAEAEASAAIEADDRAAAQQRLTDLAVAELDARQRAAETRKVRGKDQETEREIELLEISTERRLLDIEQSERAAAQAKQDSQDRIDAYDREIERNRQLGADVRLLEAQRTIAHRSFVEQFGTQAELAELDADLAVSRQVREREARTERAQAEADAYQRGVELLEARGSAEQDYAQRRIELEMQVASAAGDTDRVRQLMHTREVARIKREVEVRKTATSATGQLLTQGMNLFSLVAERSIKDEAKREKAMMRARGIEAMARGALETVEAVASFASFNFVQGALHTAAAAVAFGTGISLLAGKVPNKGGAAGAAGAAGGGAEHQTVLADGTDTSRRESVAVPPSAEELIRLREGATGTVQTTAAKEGGNVYNIGTIVAGDAGTLIDDLDDQTARKWGAA